MEKVFASNSRICFFFLALSLLFYGNSIKNSFSFDDSYVTVTNFPDGKRKFEPNNPGVAAGIKGIPQLWRSRYGHGKGTAFDYRPVVTTSFAIEYSIYGSSPHMNHFINVILYSLILFLLFLVLRKCLSAYPFRDAFALVCCLLFLAHPIHTEVIDSIKSRDELLGLLFGLLSTWQVLRYADDRKWVTLVWAALFFVLAIYSKLTSAVFAVLIPITWWFFVKANRKQLIFLLLAALAVFILQLQLKRGLLLEKEIRILYHFENPLATEHVSFLERIIFALKTLGFYIRMLVFPYPLRFYYGSAMFTTEMNPTDVHVWVAVIFVALAAFYCYRTRDRIAIFGLLFFLISIAPVLNLLRPVAGIVGERLVFAPSVGFFIFITAVLFRSFKSAPVVSWRLFLARPVLYVSVLLPVFLVYDWKRNENWYDELTLFEHDAPHLTRSAGANNLIANKYFDNLENPKYDKQFIIEKCWTHYNFAVKADSSVFSAFNNAGVIAYRFYNKPELALSYFRSAIANCPDDFPQANENLGDCYLKLGDTLEAAAYYEKALSQNPRQYKSYLNLVTINYKRGKVNEALKYLNRAWVYFPKSSDILMGQATCLRLLGRPREALQKFEETYQLYPRLPIADSILSVARTLNDTQVIKKYLDIVY